MEHWLVGLWALHPGTLLHTIIITQFRFCTDVWRDWSVISIIPRWLHELLLLLLWLLGAYYPGLLRLSTRDPWLLDYCSLHRLSHFDSVLSLALSLWCSSCNVNDWVLCPNCMGTGSVVDLWVHLASIQVLSKFWNFRIGYHSNVPAWAPHSTRRLSSKWSSELVILLVQTVL